MQSVSKRANIQNKNENSNARYLKALQAFHEQRRLQAANPNPQPAPEAPKENEKPKRKRKSSTKDDTSESSKPPPVKKPRARKGEKKTNS
jgi:hypothetical protein